MIVSSTAPTLASWVNDQATQDAVEICDRSFGEKNADIPVIKKSQAKKLHLACTWGVQYGHEANYEPYQHNEREVENKDYPIALPPLWDFRRDYEAGIQRCLASGPGYPKPEQLPEAMACMDGFDAFAGNIVAMHPDTKVNIPPTITFDHDYYKKHDFKTVYTDIQNSRDWAYVLADRTFHPERYPGYRRDMLFAPDIPPRVKSRADAAYAAANPQGSSGSSSSTNTSNNNALLWYWWIYHMNHGGSSSYATSTATSYRQDGGARMGYAGATVSGPPSPGDDRRAFYGGGGGGAGYAGSGGGSSSAVAGASSSATAGGSSGAATSTGATTAKPGHFGPTAAAGEFSKASPWNATKLTTTTSGQLGAGRSFIVRGGLGAYGGNAGRADGARVGSIPKTSSPTFNTYTAPARSTFTSSATTTSRGGYGASSMGGNVSVTSASSGRGVSSGAVSAGHGGGFGGGISGGG